MVWLVWCLTEVLDFGVVCGGFQSLGCLRFLWLLSRGSWWVVGLNVRLGVGGVQVVWCFGVWAGAGLLS